MTPIRHTHYRYCEGDPDNWSVMMGSELSTEIGGDGRWIIRSEDPSYAHCVGRGETKTGAILDFIRQRLAVPGPPASALDALLAVAKAAKEADDESKAEASPFAVDLTNAIAALDALHPDWREWGERAE